MSDPASNPTPRLFLSYGRRDAQPLADRLKADLEAHGFEVWQDTRQIRTGKAWEEEIKDGLRSTQLVVAVLSPHAVRKASDPNSPDNLDSVCLDELSFARFAQPPRPIVPVMAISCEPPFCIFRLDYVDLCAWRDSKVRYRAGLMRLLEGIAAGIRGETRYRTWEARLRPWDFGALLNEKRQDFCGRQWLFDEIDAWRISSRERALLILGDPGSGKSAVVAELVHQNPGGQVLAYHFCQADTRETLQPGRFVRSLAGMIASQLDDYAVKLADPAVDEALSEARCNSDPASAFEAGILTPLESLAAPGGGTRYLLIDALDEALSLGEGSARGTLVDLLASRLNRLPAWLRLVATSRKEPAVLNRLSGLRARELDAHDSRNLEDIDLYTTTRLASPNLAERLNQCRRSPYEVARILREKGEGNFLYVQQALEGVERDLYGFDRIDELPPGLTGLYLRSFERLFPDDSRYARARRLLQVLVAAREPLNEEQLARATGLDVDAELPTALRALAAYLHRRDGRYTLFHKSLFDWLVGDRLNEYYASPKQGHERLADLCLGEYRRGPRTMSPYAVAHLAMHLVHSDRWDQLDELLLDLAYLEAKAEAGLVFDLALELDEVQNAWPAQSPTPPFLRFIKEAVSTDLHFLTRHPTALFQCLWNRCWWYDSPESAFHFEPPQGGWDAAGPPWLRTGPKMYQLLERRRREKEVRQPDFLWVRSRRPPSMPLGAGQRLALKGHTSDVHGVALSVDGTRLVSCSRDGTIRVWNSRGGQETLCIHAGNAPVYAVAVSSDGRWIASAAAVSKSVPVWDMQAGTISRELGPGDAPIECLAFSPDGRRIAAGCEDATVRVWNLDDGLEVLRLRGHANRVGSVAFSPDGSRIVSGGHWGGSDHTVRVWDGNTGEQLLCMPGHSSNVHRVAYSPDGSLIASCSGDAGGDYSIKLWDAGIGTLLATLKEHRESVKDVGFSPDGKRLVSGSWDETVRIWDLSTGRTLAVLAVPGKVNAVGFFPDCRRVYSAGYDDAVRVLDALAPQALPVRKDVADNIWSLAISPDGRRLASGSERGAVCLWDVQSGRLLHDPLRQPGPLNNLCFSPDGRSLATCTGTVPWDFGERWSGESDFDVRIVEVEGGRQVAGLTGHTDKVRCLRYSGRGSFLVSGGDDRTVRVWDTATHREVQCVRGHLSGVFIVAVSPDERWIASLSRDGNLRIWDAHRRREILSVQEQVVTDVKVSFSADSRRLLLRTTEQARIWDVESGRCLSGLPIEDCLLESFSGSQVPAWKVRLQEPETAIIEATSEQPVAWFPVPLYRITGHPSGRVWAACSGQVTAHGNEARRLELIALEGPPTSNTVNMPQGT